MARPKNKNKFKQQEDSVISSSEKITAEVLEVNKDFTEEKSQNMKESSDVLEAVKTPKAPKITLSPKRKPMTLLRTSKSVTRDAQLYIPNYDVVIVDDENGNEKQVAIRYITGASSLFLKDQEDLEDRGERILIRGYSTTISSSEILKQEFLSMTDFNGSKKDRDTRKPIFFYVEDKEAEVKKEMDEFNILSDAISMFRTMQASEIRMMALAIPSIRGFVGAVPENELSYMVGKYSQQNPAKFLELKDDPNTEIYSILCEAESFQIINARRQANRVVWGVGGTQSGHLIVDVPVGHEPLTYMCNWILTGTGLKTYEEIKDRVEKEVHKKMS